MPNDVFLKYCICCEVQYFLRVESHSKYKKNFQKITETEFPTSQITQYNSYEFLQKYE